MEHLLSVNIKYPKPYFIYWLSHILDYRTGERMKRSYRRQMPNKTTLQGLEMAQHLRTFAEGISWPTAICSPGFMGPDALFCLLLEPTCTFICTHAYKHTYIRVHLFFHYIC